MNQFIKYLKPIFIVAVAIYLFDQSRILISGGEWGDFNLELQKFSIFFIYSFVIGMANIWTVKKLNTFFPWKEAPKKRAVYGVVGALVVSMVSIGLLRALTVMLLANKSWHYFITHESIFMYYYSMIITLVIVLVFYVIHFYKTIAGLSIKKHQVVANTETAKYETLKSQLDPHFLFNSLNVLTSLIEENPENAAVFTSKLSKVYRYVLEQKDKDLVLLTDELHFAKNYMELLQMRFEDALQFELPDTIANKEYKIIPLALQMLLENAVKHNIISSENPLFIKMQVLDGILYIQNNFSKKDTITEGAGVGLTNIIERYALLTDKKVVINKSETDFSIMIPLLTQKIKSFDRATKDQKINYIQAQRRVNNLKEFYTNLIAFSVVIPILAYINYTTNWDYKWFIYPMIGWGIGLIFNFLRVSNHAFFLGKDWEDKKVKEIMNKERKDHKEMWQ